MSEETITLVMAAASTLGAFGALAAALGAWRSAQATRHVAEGQQLLQFMQEYGAPDMLSALRTLRKWEAEHGRNFAKAWRKALDNSEPKAREVDLARRHVVSYFLRALSLYDSGYVTARFMKAVGSYDGVNILYDIVEPLEFALNPKYDRENFDRLRKIWGRPGTGGLIAPLPG